MCLAHSLISDRGLLLLVLAIGCFQNAFAAERIELCINKTNPDKKAEPPKNRFPRPRWLPAALPWFATGCAGDEWKRTAIVEVPKSTTVKDKVPLVINIHGNAANALLQEFLTKFDDTADKYGFIVVYPEGYSKVSPNPAIESYSWNAGGCCSEKPIDDISFMRKLIEYVQTKYPIDEGKIYATGMSNGGFMSNRVACEMSDIIAAAAPVAGPLMERFDPDKPHPFGWGKEGAFTCNPENRVPLLHVHSSNDLIVPFKGSAEAGDAGIEAIIPDFWEGTARQLIGNDLKLLGFPSAEDSVGNWRGFNNVQDSGEVVEYSDDTTCTLYNNHVEGAGQNFAPVELCVSTSKEALGHCWPGKEEMNMSLFSGIDLSPASLISSVGQCQNEKVGNDYIWKFFDQFRREAGGSLTKDEEKSEIFNQFRRAGGKTKNTVLQPDESDPVEIVVPVMM